MVNSTKMKWFDDYEYHVVKLLVAIQWEKDKERVSVCVLEYEAKKNKKYP